MIHSRHLSSTIHLTALFASISPLLRVSHFIFTHTKLSELKVFPKSVQAVSKRVQLVAGHISKRGGGVSKKHISTSLNIQLHPKYLPL